MGPRSGDRENRKKSMKTAKSANFATTPSWYDANANIFAARTLAMNVPVELNSMLDTLKAGSRVLDAGCGAGRDLLAIAQRGHEAEGVDGSHAMAAIAHSVSGRPVRHLDLRLFDDPAGSWDAIWCCATPLHFERAEARAIMRALGASLTAGGVMCASVKAGAGQSIDGDGRPFQFWTPAEIAADIAGAGLDLRHMSVTDTAASSGNMTRWIGVCVRKSAVS